EQIGGEKRPHPGLHLVGERSSHGEIVLALFPQVTGKPFDGLSNLLGAGFGNWRSRRGVGNLVFNGGVKVVERGGCLGRLMQNVAAAEAREVIGRIAKPKLMNGAVSTEE